MYRKLDRKSSFTSAAIWLSSTLESCEYIDKSYKCTHQQNQTSIQITADYYNKRSSNQKPLPISDVLAAKPQMKTVKQQNMPLPHTNK